MADFIDDGALIGFWPLSEPSGAPLFKNYSPAYSQYPSGLSFDMQVHVADDLQDENYRSLWPGTDTIANAESGVNIRGYRAQGHFTLMSSNSEPRSKCLILGHGDKRTIEQLLPHEIAQSGFTAGFWVYPTTDGYLDWHNDGGIAPASVGWDQASSYVHALYGQFRFDADEAGWIMGVSGAVNQGAQFVVDPEHHQLNAFLSQCDNGGTPEIHLDTPIESGRYTHITMSYRYVDGTSNELAFYKDGRVVGSGTTDFDLTKGNAVMLARPLTIGGSNNAIVTNEYSHTTGWGHLVSGAYYFNRVLHEGEILDLHLQGGLQPAEANLADTKEVTLYDSKLLSYIPFDSPTYVDASKNFRPFTDDYDLGDEGDLVIGPGPFGGVGRLQDSSAGSSFVVASSGLCSDLLDSRSWSIGIWATAKQVNAREDNMVLSWGSVTSTTAASANPLAATSEATMGLVITEEAISRNHMRLEAYPLGDLNADRLLIYASGFEFYDRVHSHYGVVYDDQTYGLAFYVNGILQGSGNFASSFTDHLTRLVGSGYPFMFANGVQDGIADSALKGVHSDGGQDNWIGGNITIMGRPLEPCEMRAVAISGINTIPTKLSRHDSRLMGYWPCDDYQDGDILVEDKARNWQDVPGHLCRGDSLTKWERAYNRGGTQPDQSVYRFDGTAFIDLYADRDTPPELASYGTLGITSGVWGVRGGGMGCADKPNSLNVRSARGNVSVRYKPNIEQRSLSPQNYVGGYVLGFEVTPSGDIQPYHVGQLSNTNKLEFNSCIFNYGNLGGGASHGEQRAFLTSINAPFGSGISVVFQNRTAGFTAANTRMVCSGNLTYGVPNKVLLYGRFDDPYSRTTVSAGTAPYRISLYINGEHVQTIVRDISSLYMWDVGPPNSDDDHYLLQFGGEIGNDLINQQFSRDSGLGENYLREMFIMRGAFTSDEIEELATSGIRTTAFPGYIAQKPKTQVTISDDDLRGYWRFNGFAGGPAHGVQGSGTSDLSSKANHLLPFAEIQSQRGINTEAAHYLRAMPGPHVNSDLGVQCSGLTYESNAVSNLANDRIAPFMASGIGIDDPAAGFSVGFLMAKREDVTTSRFDGLLAYGTVAQSTVADTTVEINRGWFIGMDDLENMKMVMSQGGNMYLDNAGSAAHSGQVTCGCFDSSRIDGDLTNFENYIANGDQHIPRLDYWSHYVWTYDATDNTLRCYLNGDIIDEQPLKTAPEFWDGPQNPTAEARYLTFFQHTEDTPWNFAHINTSDFDSVLTDVFYFSRTLTDAEARYIAFNGIDDTAIASNVVGGWTHGQDTVSGIVAGYMPGSIQVSGIVGGYVSGVVFGDGTVGGWVRGLDVMSGVIAGHIHGLDVGSGMIAGYLHGQDIVSGIFGGYMYGSTIASNLVGGIIFGSQNCSGIIGGYILGGFEGGLVEFDASYTVQVMSAQDFDTQLHVQRTDGSNFDAKVVIFEDEIGPLITVETPSMTVSGLAPPFNQYFVGKASGQQGKTITKARWTFGDLTPSVDVTESGAGYYPSSHYYAASGFYIAKFEAIDSDGQHGSATRIIHAASGIDPVIVSLSGVPRSGSAALTIDFTTVVDILPPGVIIVAKLLNYDDGQSTVSFNPTHVYSEPGVYKPTWTVRDSRGVIWNDSLAEGNDLLESGG